MIRRFALCLLFLAGCRAHQVGPVMVADGGLPDDGTGPSLATRGQAVQATITGNATCSALPSFYWEMGDAGGALVSGSVGGVGAGDEMAIASASKLMWGAYVVERFKGNLAAIDLNAMSMRSGYVSLTYESCVGKTTVDDCFTAGQNSTHTAADDDHFYYNGGHFQKYAVDLGLGGDDDAQLAAEMKQYLGSDLTFTFGSPQLAGGVHTSAADYALFLRKILAGTLAIHDQLGAQATCTQPSTCATALYSPAPAAWHYSYAHWVEDDPQSGDGAFSSPGAFGFYPWIDSSKSYYGILARYSLVPQAYVQSAECGALLRKAFLTGVAQ